MTKAQIINETVKYYSEDTSRRAYRGSACFYFQKDSGNMCAVGRCANDPQGLDGGKYIRNILLEMSDEEVFKPEYQGHTTEFWAKLQDFHDSQINWDEKGLISYGQERVLQLKEMFA